MKKVIQVTNLKKTYGNLNAVDGISFSMYENYILCLLVHNGAGKTTAINMLTGMMESSGGDASVYGYKISRDIQAVQRNLGLC